ncbi:MAG: ABC transporter ATP-binding protein [Alphaproteobacteria bacterium]|nr:MAG: ABC transporter ATP-binding protein [Alphaproteobacteria bacterium]
MTDSLPFPNKPLPMLIHFARQTPLLAMGFILIPLLSQSLYASLTYATKQIIDALGTLTPHADRVWTVLTPPLALFVGILLVRFALTFVQWFVAYHLRFPLLARMRRAVFAHVQRHANGWFDDELSGKIAHKVMLLPEQLMKLYELAAWDFFPTLATLAVTGVLMMQAGWGFVVGICLWAVVYIGFCAWRARYCAIRSEDHNTAKTAVTGRIVDAIANIRNLITFAHHAQEDAYLGGYVEDEKYRRRQVFLAYASMRVGQYILDIVLWLGMFTGALWAWQEGRMTTGDVVMMVGLVTILSKQIWNLGEALSEVIDNYGAAREATRMLIIPHEMPDAPGARGLEIKGGEIRLEDLRFAYPDGAVVFDGMRLTIPAGQKLGLVGASGVGKSTLVSLLLRLYDVSGGRILIDGQDIRGVTQESLRGQIALIPQDTTLFHRSLRENIGYGRPSASEADIRHAAHAAHAHEFIDKLPQGYDSMVGERGVKLSGGQRQRLAVARALLKDAPILILDEATSALDSESEAAIQDSLKLAMQGRTVVAIAHRLSTIMHLDRLVVLDQGGIVEDGTHAQLLAKGGIYAGLWRRQSGGFLQEDGQNLPAEPDDADQVLTVPAQRVIDEESETARE